jgi:hypothetical protein
MGWESSNRRSELPKDWSKLRQKALKRDAYQCVAEMLDGSRCPEAATEVDHVGDRLNHSMANLRSLCHWHHAKRTAQQSADAQRAKRTAMDKRFRRTEKHPGEL